METKLVIESIENFVDPHLLLHFVRVNGLEGFEEMKKRCLLKTKVYKEIEGIGSSGDLKQALEESKKKFASQKSLLQSFIPEAIAAIESGSELGSLTNDQLTFLSQYAKCLFEEGNYKEASKVIDALKSNNLGEIEEIQLNVYWGDFILSTILNNGNSKSAFKGLKSKIEQGHFKFAQEMSQKTSLLCSAVLLYLSPNSSEEDFEYLLSLLTNEKFI